MMNIKERIKALQKIAQQGAAPITTQPGLPTVSGSPQPIGISTYFPSVIKGWGGGNLQSMQIALDALNWATYIIGGQQFDLNKFRQSYFIPTVTNVQDSNLLPIIRFAAVVYNNLLTPSGGTSQFNTALDQTERNRRKEIVLQAMLAPRTLIPDGSINNNLPGKIGGNLKIVLNSALTQLK